MTRAEHLNWCKQRALEYVATGDLSQAVASMTSDLHQAPRNGIVGAHAGNAWHDGNRQRAASRQALDQRVQLSNSPPRYIRGLRHERSEVYALDGRAR
jgi:hypothetical protein